MPHYGVDVSSNNQHPMAWPAIYAELKALGGGEEPFAIIKITQGTGYVNPDQAIDVVQARAAGFKYLAGYLMDQGNDQVAAEEALYQKVSTLPQTDDIELPEGLSVAEYVQHAHDLINIHPRALSYLNQSQVHEGFPGGAGLWLAEYNNNPGSVITPSTIHQYTSSCSIPGAAGAFDMNIWLDTEEYFQSFFGGAAQEPVAPTSPPVTQAAQPASGVPDLEVIGQLVAAAKKQTLRLGSTGLAVGMLQVKLSQDGFNEPHLVDPVETQAVFGQATLASVKAFQRAHRLTVDGIVGPKTWAVVFPS
jgi:hypothetical protein